MASRIFKRITNNLGLKIIALLGAIGLWLIVVNVEDPEITSNFTVSVDTLNENYLTNNNKIYSILDGTDTIRVSVTAKRSIIGELSNSDLQASADLSQIELNSGATIQQVPIEVSARRYSGRISLGARSYYLKVEMNDRVDSEVPVQIEYVGTAAEGCAIGSMTATPSTLTISGPDSIVNSISFAKVTVDISGAVRDFSSRLEPTFYTADGNKVDASRLTTDVSDVMVYVEVLEQKTLSVSYAAVGTPAEGYVLDSVSGSVDTIVVKGNSYALSKIDSLVIGDINVDGLSADEDRMIQIEDYLPSGVELFSTTQDEAIVHITLKESETKPFILMTDKIEISGLRGEQTAEISGAATSFTAFGAPEVMKAVTVNDFKASIDLSGYDYEGTYLVEIQLECPENVSIAAKNSLTVVISGNAPGVENPEESTSADERVDEENLPDEEATEEDVNN